MIETTHENHYLVWANRHTKNAGPEFQIEFNSVTKWVAENCPSHIYCIGWKSIRDNNYTWENDFWTVEFTEFSDALRFDLTFG